MGRLDHHGLNLHLLFRTEYFSLRFNSAVVTQYPGLMVTVYESARTGYNALAEKVSTIDKTIAESNNKKELVAKLQELKVAIMGTQEPLHAILQDKGPSSYKVLETENKRLADEIKSVKRDLVRLETANEKLKDYENVVTKVQDVMDGWKSNTDTVDMSIKREVKKVVKNNLKEIMTETVKTIFKTEKMEKTFADVLKNSEKRIVQETKKCFEQSLTSALKESQSEIISTTSARQEADTADKEKRIRNVVITTVPESELPEIPQRIAADKIIAAEILDVSTDDIERCFRAGPPLGTGSNKERTGPRPLIVVLATPELARGKHKYGNGCRVNKDGVEYWINPDQSRAERRANFEARRKRRERMSSDNLKNSENSANVATS